MPGACALVVLLTAVGASAAAPISAADAAKKYYAAGRLDYDAGRYQDALGSFEKAYAAQPLPGLLFNIGQCHRKLGNDQESLDHFKRYLKALPQAPNRAQVRELISHLEARLDPYQPSLVAPPAPEPAVEVVEPAAATHASAHLPTDAEPAAAAASTDSEPPVTARPALTEDVSQRELLLAGAEPALVAEVLLALKGLDVRLASEVHVSHQTELETEHERALAAVRSARQAYLEGDVERAWLNTGVAVSRLERSFGAMREPDRVARAYLFRAELASARGQTETAEDSFVMAARLAPALQLDPATTSPMVIEGFQTARELLANSPPGGLTVVTTPVGATVWIDGELRGPAPLSVAVPAAPHLVKVTHPGYETWTTQVPVAANDVRELEVFMVAAGPLDLAMQARGDERLQLLGELDPDRDWLVVERAEGGVRYSLLTRDLRVVDQGPVAPGELPAVLGAPASVASIEDDEPQPLHWGWIAAGVGGGIAALGGLGALALEGVFNLTDLGSGEDRRGMLLGERVLAATGALGLAGGLAGVTAAFLATDEDGDAPQSSKGG